MKEKVFFSDLDRTLIFSKKFLTDTKRPILVEAKDKKPISYMTKEAFSLLEKVRQECVFIPVSTRNYETMIRIRFIKETIPKWMITDNGAHIYYNGKLLKVWEEKIKEQKMKVNTPVSDFENQLHSLFEDKGLNKVINFENLYLMLKFDEMTWEVRQTLEVLSIGLSKKGYRIDVNSRKAYILPEYLTKEKAVRFLMDFNEWDFTIGAGDSLMDLGMLRETKYGITPKHGELDDEFTHVTTKEGLDAGEEILHCVQHIIRYKYKLV